MKKSIIVGVLSTAFLIASCGDEGKEEGKEESSCKTGNGVKISCEDSEAYKQLNDLIDKFELTFPKNKEEYNTFISTNEAVLAEIEPIWGSIENIVKADPGLLDHQPYTKTMGYREDVEMYKSILADLENISVSLAQTDSLFMISFKNGSSKAVKEVRGFMQYLDAEGNVVCEKEYELSASKLDLENGIPAGYEGETDKGIYCNKEDQVSSLKFEVSGLDYFE